MSEKNVLHAAQEYFSNINPIAARIYADFEEIKNSYESVWSTLSSEEQTQILNEYIIKPEVTLKYSLKPTVSNEKSEDTVDAKESNRKFKDEHGRPFSYKTLSQIDLRMFGNNEIEIKKSPKVEQVQVKVPEEVIEKSVTPTAAGSSGGDTLPKTGLDFLDNW